MRGKKKKNPRGCRGAVPKPRAANGGGWSSSWCFFWGNFCVFQVHEELRGQLDGLEPQLLTDLVWSLCVLQQAKPHYLQRALAPDFCARIQGETPPPPPQGAGPTNSDLEKRRFGGFSPQICPSGRRSPVKFSPCLFLRGGDWPAGCHSELCRPWAPRPLFPWDFGDKTVPQTPPPCPGAARFGALPPNFCFFSPPRQPIRPPKPKTCG